MSEPDQIVILPRPRDELDTEQKTTESPEHVATETVDVDTIASPRPTALPDESPAEDAAPDENEPVTAPDEGIPARQRALAQLSWIASGLLMGALGLLRSGWPGLWADETATWGMTTVGWTEFWALLRSGDVVIGPYYVLVRAWSEVAGNSDFALRLPSVLAMAGAAALIAAIGSRLATPRIGMLAGVFFAIIPITSRYAQEARPYALAVFAVALSTLLLLRFLDRPGFWRATAYFFAVVLIGAFHLVALAVLAAHLLIVLTTRPKAIVGWLPAVLLGGGAAVPLLLLGNEQKAQIGWIGLTDADSLLALPGALFGTVVLGGIVLALAFLAISFRKPAVVPSLWALLPLAVIFVAGHYTPLWSIRYLLFTLPAWALLAAIALGRAPLVRGIFAIAVVGLIALPGHLDMRKTDGHNQDPRGMAAVITAYAQPSDTIVYGSAPSRGRVGRDLVTHYVPSEKRPVDALVVREARTDGNIFATECSDVPKCLGATPRIWVLRESVVKNPLTGLGAGKEKALAGYRMTQIWHPRGLTLALYVRKPS